MNASRLLLLAGLSGLSVPLLAGPPAGETWQKRLDEVRDLVGAGRCDEALTKLEVLRRERRRDPDLLTLEANCLVNRARHLERRFQPELNDRLLIGLGTRRLPPEFTQRMVRIELRFDRGPVRRALALFRKARRLAPERRDFVVGSIAVMSQVGRTDEAIELLERRADILTPADRQDLRAIVSDLLALQQSGSAGRLAQTMGRLFPGDPAAAAARIQVALAREREDLDEALEARRSVAELPADARSLDRRLARRLLIARRWADAVPLLVGLARQDPVAGSWLGIARERLARGSSASVWATVRRQMEAGVPVPRSLPRLVDHYERTIGDPQAATVAMRARATTFFLERKLPIAALAEADAAVTEAPEDPLGWEALARVLRREARFEQALAALGHVSDSAERDLRARVERMRGELLFALGRNREAASALDRAEAAGAPAPFPRALVALALGERDRAIALLERVAAADDPDAERARKRLESLAARGQPTGT